MNEDKNGRNLVVVIVIIIVAAIIAAVWLSWRGSGAPVNPEATDFLAAQEANQLASLEVPDQFPGATVYVSRADLPAGGWVVIKQDERILGSGFFDVNTQVGNVDLIESTIDGQEYLAEVYTDDGDDEFSLATDQLVKNASGETLSVFFNVSKNLPERKG